MLKQEWKKLFKNRILLIVTVAVIVIPTIYTTLFLGSMWDPYGNIDKLPVAVVNNDEPVVYEGKELDIGKNLVDQLKENKSLAFQFPSENDAWQGLKDGTYYMVITIPEDFSADAASLTEEKPEKMMLDYATNPGTNYIASKMSETAMKELESSVREEVTKTYVQVMFDKISEAGEGFAEASDGSGKVYEGAEKLADGNAIIMKNLNVLADSTLVFADGSEELAVGLKKYTQGTAAIDQGVSALAEGVEDAQKGGSHLAEGAADVDDNMLALHEGLSRLSKEASALPNAADALKAGAESLADGTGQAVAGLDSVASGIESLKSGMDSLSCGLKDVVGDENSQSGALRDGAAQLSQALAGLSESCGDSAELQEQISVLQKQADLLADSITDYTYGVDSAAEGSRQILTQFSILQTGVSDVKSGMGQLESGAEELKNGINGLAEKAPQLSMGLSSAVSGAEKLQQQGTSVLRQGASDMESGLDALAIGSSQLQRGTRNLASNAPALNQGSAAMTDGAVQISKGAEKLSKGNSELGEGISRLCDGAAVLSENLREGADQIRKTNLSDLSAEQFAAPAEIKETQITDVANNGHAMAPYMMSVGLWVGCIAFSLMYPLTSPASRIKSGFQWWMSKASVLYLTAVIQAVVMIAALHVFDGFAPVEMGKTILVACAASMAFMSIMYFFTSLLGRVGSFLMLIFMVIQLAGSVGTYPYEISGDFVPYLHGWVPFTYSVKAFRSTVSGGESIAGCVIFFVILLVVFSSFTILEFTVRAGKIRNGKNTWLMWLESHGLA